eukprot:gene1829-2054_t
MLAAKCKITFTCEITFQTSDGEQLLLTAFPKTLEEFFAKENSPDEIEELILAMENTDVEFNKKMIITKPSFHQSNRDKDGDSSWRTSRIAQSKELAQLHFCEGLINANENHNNVRKGGFENILTYAHAQCRRNFTNETKLKRNKENAEGTRNDREECNVKEVVLSSLSAKAMANNSSQSRSKHPAKEVQDCILCITQPAINSLTSLEASRDFCANSHVMARLRKELKDRTLIKTRSSHKELMAGMEKKKEVPKATSVLKEDHQALGLLVSKCPDKKDAFSYPLTTYPLAIAMPEGILNKPNTKHLFRNHLVEVSDALKHSAPSSAANIYDAMAVIRAISFQQTWSDLWGALLRAFSPPLSTNASEVVIVPPTLRSNRRRQGKENDGSGADNEGEGVNQRRGGARPRPRFARPQRVSFYKARLPWSQMPTEKMRHSGEQITGSSSNFSSASDSSDSEGF